MVNALRNRWKALAAEPWFDFAAHRHGEMDWEGEAEAIDAMVFEIAKARGLDLSQKCPRCKQVRVQVATIDPRHGECEECEWRDAKRHAENRERDAEARANHERWRASLTPEQRAEYDRQRQEECRLTMHGLVARDVQ